MDEDLELFEIEEEEEEIMYPKNLPPGFIFQPTEEELVIHYLTNKIQGLPLPCEGVVGEVDISKYHPQALSEKYTDIEYEGAWYFFTKRVRKYEKGTRPMRGGTYGYWKAQDKDAPIIRSRSKSKPKSKGKEEKEVGVEVEVEVVDVLGWKQVLKFKETMDRKNDREGISTRWLMHEYRINQETSTFDDLVVCRIYLSRKDKQDLRGSKPNKNLAQNPVNPTADIQQVSDPNQTLHQQQDPNPISNHTIPNPQQQQEDPIQNYQLLHQPNLTPTFGFSDEDAEIFEGLHDVFSGAHDFLPDLPDLPPPDEFLNSTSLGDSPPAYNIHEYDINSNMDFSSHYGPVPVPVPVPGLGPEPGPLNFNYGSPQFGPTSSWSTIDSSNDNEFGFLGSYVDDRMF